MRTLIFFALLAAFAVSQVSVPGTPLSFNVPLTKSLPTIVLPSLNINKLLEEDRIEQSSNLKAIPPRFAVPIKVEFNLHNSGVWETLPDTSRVWRLKVRAPNAKATYLIFDKYRVPEGATLFVIGAGKSFKGAFTSLNNKDHLQFSIAPTEGEEFILEYYEPRNVVGLGQISLSHVMFVYKDIFSPKNGRSGLCNFNVVCPIGAAWKNEIRSVAAIMTGTFGRVCSGAMINTATKEKKKYFLTASHCGTMGSNHILVFNYQSETCERGGDRHLRHTVSGLKTLARYTATDFQLLEIEEPIPKEYNVYLAGWNAIDVPEQNVSVAIHHPSGDVKKISFTYAPLTHDRWSSEFDGSHWKVQRWFNGTTEPGSSGSPLFDSQHRIVGQLHGGYASCSRMMEWDKYGKISKSFDHAKSKDQRLKEWLDPDNLGIRALDGRNYNDE